MIKIECLDHLVLTVKDIETICAFYRNVLGLHVIPSGKLAKPRAFGQQNINLHQPGRELEPNANPPAAGSADLCFITQTPLIGVLSYLCSCGIDIIEGSVHRTGASGVIESVYFRDPDLNLI